MQFKFINREKELKELNRLLEQGKGGLITIFGRRRIGKTRLLREWIQKHQGFYTQAIEGHPLIQLEQLFLDLKPGLHTEIAPKTWEELFQLIELEKEPVILCIDEFPYLVTSDETIPSRFQRWIDHTKKDNLFLILSGSSYRMMHSLFLHPSTPLYGRAIKLIHIEPMAYTAFCKAIHLDASQMESFILFSMVGGVPKYWEYLKQTGTVSNLIETAESLFFEVGAYMEYEPRRLLVDEKIEGINPISVLELIGRGMHRLSEIAARMGQPSTNLTRIIQLLLDSSLIKREIPFGENEKNSKKSLYKITDPSVRFWFQVYSPHRSRWNFYKKTEKQVLLINHASSVFEDYVRLQYSGSSRYWDPSVEFDLVRWQKERETAIISEVKFKKLSAQEKQQLLKGLEKRYEQSTLSKQIKHALFEVKDSSFLEQ